MKRKGLVMLSVQIASLIGWRLSLYLNATPITLCVICGNHMEPVSVSPSRSVFLFSTCCDKCRSRSLHLFLVVWREVLAACKRCPHIAGYCFCGFQELLISQSKLFHKPTHSKHWHFRHVLRGAFCSKTLTNVQDFLPLVLQFIPILGEIWLHNPFFFFLHDAGVNERQLTARVCYMLPGLG